MMPAAAQAASSHAEWSMVTTIRRNALVRSFTTVLLVPAVGPVVTPGAVAIGRY